jgi:hypothetical protein
MAVFTNIVLTREPGVSRVDSLGLGTILCTVYWLNDFLFSVMIRIRAYTFGGPRFDYRLYQIF